MKLNPRPAIQGKVAIITGASSGIGEATAREFAKAGAITILAARREGRLKRLQREIEEMGGLDLQILGIGRTGHIGFNEPGSAPNSGTRLVTLDDLHLPINRPVVIQLSSKDVIHSFGVPAMRVKTDATPGLLSPVWFTPTLAGQFDIACSQLCGLGHFRMKATITVESDAEYRAFLAAEAALLR